jgi:hypothetical protein
MKPQDISSNWTRMLPSPHRFLLSIAVSLVAVIALTFFAFAGHAAAPSYDGAEHYSTPASYQTPASSVQQRYFHHSPAMPSPR